MKKTPPWADTTLRSCLPNRGLIDFLEAISTRLHAHQTVGEVFSDSQLAELGGEFNLSDSDWARLARLIRRPKHWSLSRP